MVSKLAYVHKVVCHAAHYFTRFVIIVIRIGKLFKMIEHIASHLRLHTHAHYVAVILNEIIQQLTHEVEEKQPDTEKYDHLIFLIRNKVVKHRSCYDGVEYTDKGYEKGCRHIENEYSFVGLIIRQELF